MKDLRLQDLQKEGEIDCTQKIAEQIQDCEGVLDVSLLPDSFVKDKFLKEVYNIAIPSSSVIVTQGDHLYPQFRSRGVNCGMMVVALPIHKDELSEKFVQEMFSAFAYDPLYYLLFRSRIPVRLSKFDLTKKDFDAIVRKGARYVLEKHNLDIDNVEKFDFGGVIKIDNPDDIAKHTNQDWFKRRLGRLTNGFGRYLGGNHFMEVQTVTEDAPEYGLKKDQVVIMLHTAGEAMEDILRTDFVEEYIKQHEFICATDPEVHDAFFASQAILMNYGYAYRASAFAIISDVFRRYKLSDQKPRVVIDKGHNHAFRNEVGDIVYRHNAEILEDGASAIISGTYNHNSYIVKGLSQITELHNTIDHGLGFVLEQQDGHIYELEERVRMVRYKRGIKSVVTKKEVQKNLFTNPIIEQYFNLMQEKEYCKKVAEFKPLYNMKFTK